MSSSTDAVIALDPEGSDIQGELARIRERGPVVLVDVLGIKAWMVTDAAVLKQLLVSPQVSKDPHDWPVYLEGKTKDWPLDPWINTRSAFTTAGAEHRSLRKPFANWFTAARVNKLEPSIRDLSETLLLALEKAEGPIVDLRQQYAYPLPIQVITSLLGVPEHLHQPLRACVDVVFDTSASPAEFQESYQRMIGLLVELVNYRRDNLGDDLTSALVREADDSETTFTTQDCVGTLYLLINAGHETTATLLDQAIVLLLTHPEVRADVCQGRLEWNQVVEEVLRYEPAVASVPMRYATEDITVGGVTIAKGDAILVSYAGANRDPDVHGPTSNTFDPARSTAHDHIAFGHGAHRCPGAPLARLEALIGLRGLFERFPEVQLAPGEELTPGPGFIGNGHRRIPALLRGTQGRSAASGGWFARLVSGGLSRVRKIRRIKRS